MATSNSTDWALIAQDVVTLALRRLRVLPQGSDASGSHLQNGLDELNQMLKSWQMSEASPNLWRQTEGSITLVADTASYTLSPRPYRVISARYRNTSSIDLPMFELTREEYQQLPNKAASGLPTSFYTDYQRDAVTCYVWPVPSSVTTETIKYDYQRRFEDVDAQSNELDIPQEYHDCIVYNLADRMQALYGKDLPQITRRAAMLLADASAADREAIVRFEPDWRR